MPILTFDRRLARLPLTNIAVPRSSPPDPVRVGELADSITRLGLLQPLVVVRAGKNHRLVAGRHRLAAVRSLGWKAVECLVLKLGSVELELAEIDENLIRKNLPYLDRAELIANRADLLEAVGRKRMGRPKKSATAADFSTAAVARTSCLSPRSVRLARQIVAGIPATVRDAVRGTLAGNSPSQLLALVKLPAGEQQETARLLAEGRHRRVGQAAVEARRNLLTPAAPGDAGDGLHVGDFRDLPVAAGSVKLLLLDPPWGTAWLPHWCLLGAWAAKVLDPHDGVLVTYASLMHLPDVTAALGEHLRYLWTLSARHSRRSPVVRNLKVLSRWRPLLVYASSQRNLNMVDVLDFGYEGKEHHPWQQSLAEAEWLVERLTRPGDLVVDGLCGSGTVAVACRRLSRRFVGGDLDPIAVATARKRLAEECGG